MSWHGRAGGGHLHSCLGQSELAAATPLAGSRHQGATSPRPRCLPATPTDDLWSLDLNKLDGWRCVRENTVGEEAFRELSDEWETDEESGSE